MRKRVVKTINFMKTRYNIYLKAQGLSLTARQQCHSRSVHIVTLVTFAANFVTTSNFEDFANNHNFSTNESMLSWGLPILVTREAYANSCHLKSYT